MKIAAIDIGSNSVHMVVVEVRPGGALRVLDRAKDMVRLGDSAFGDGRLSASAQARALSAISRFARIARRRDADAVVVVATSAVREAENGRNFLALVRRETGLRPVLLDPREEARLVWLAVRHAVDLGDRPSLLVDLGGGSMQLVIGDAHRVRHAESVPLGVLRLAAAFETARSLSRKRRKALREHIRRAVAGPAARARAAGVRQVIGTAGTVNAVARLLSTDDDAPRSGGEARTVAAEDAHALADALLSMPLERRQRLRGMEPARADSVGPGAMVVSEVLDAVGIDELRASRVGVREGIVLDHLAKHPAARSRGTAADARERSAGEAVARYGDSRAHGEHVSTLALALFDATRRIHGLGARERDWLRYGCLLHDVGHHVDYRRHHRHSWYLIKNAALEGFTRNEVEVLAVLGRYHRRGTPRDTDPEWAAIPKGRRGSVLALLALLRVADGLDRGHAQEVEAIAVRVGRKAVEVRLEGRGDLSLDAWAAEEKAGLLAMVLGRPIRFSLPPTRRRPRGSR